MTGLLILLAVLVGGALGSFASVVARRGWHRSLSGRSRCDACHRTLVWYELIPFVSFIALRGRCRTCGSQIGWSPFLWEISGGAVAAAVAVTILLVAGRANQ